MAKPSDDRPSRSPGQRQPQPHPLSLATRKRAYFAMMGICLLLIAAAWTVVWRYSTVAAVAMSAAALAIPPFAAIIANSGPVNRQ